MEPLAPIDGRDVPEVFLDEGAKLSGSDSSEAELADVGLDEGRELRFSHGSLQ